MRKTALVILGAVLVFLGIVYVPHLVGGTGPTGAGLDFQAAIAKSLPLALGVVFVGGILTSLTPCVYPLIPITVSIFGARQGVSRLKGAALSSVYVLGMAVMYTGLGIGAALTGKAFGHVMANPWVIGTVAGVFILFGISMLGAFELNVPTGLQTRLSQVGGEGWGGAFAMGLVSGVVAAPCTGPILGGVLTYVATTQNVVLGGALLFTFSIGMGLLFFVIGTFAVSLPKSGNWMDAVKSVLAVVMFVVALYFLKDVIPPLKDGPGRRPLGRLGHRRPRRRGHPHRRDPLHLPRPHGQAGPQDRGPRAPHRRALLPGRGPHRGRGPGARRQRRARWPGSTPTRRPWPRPRRSTSR